MADFNLEDEKFPDIAIMMTEKWSPLFLQYASVQISTVFYWYNSEKGPVFLY